MNSIAPAKEILHKVQECSCATLHKVQSEGMKNATLESLSSVSLTARVGFGQSWELSNQVQDIAEKHGASLVGGSAEAGQLFYAVPFGRWLAFKGELSASGFVATI